MKITKTKEVEKVTEELAIEPGTYYFEDEHHLYKISFTEDEDGWADYDIEKIQNYLNKKSIQRFTDTDDKLPWFAEQAFIGAKKIEQKEYEQEREQLIKELV